jgi:hypothetical protein
MALHLHSSQETALTVAETLCPCVHHAVFSMEVRTRPIPLPARTGCAKPSPAQPSPAPATTHGRLQYSTVRSRYGTGRDGIRRCRGTTRAGRSGGSVGRRVHAVHDEWLCRGSQLKGTAVGVRGRGVPMAGERQVARGRRGTEEGQDCVLRPGNAMPSALHRRSRHQSA